jgi:hypothetical protein
MEKKGQVTIFIIVGILIVGLILLFFLFKDSINLPTIGGEEKNPSSYLESCLEENVKEGINLLLLQGGKISPNSYKSFKFEGEEPKNISYLCYNSQDYLPCVNQEPMLIKTLENEMYNYIETDVEECFDSLTSNLKKQRYNVDATYRKFEINLDEEGIKINIDAKITLTKSDETSTQENFEIIIPSEMREIAIVAGEIINKEASTCDFNHYDMPKYKQVEITPYKTSDSSEIYKIKHKESEEEFRFAIKGCIIPSGWF